MELKVTKEKVLAAASKCTTAKQVLQEMFPEAFDNSVDLSDYELDSKTMIDVRTVYEYANKSFWLRIS